MWHDIVKNPADLPIEFEGEGFSVDVILRIQMDGDAIFHSVGYCQFIEPEDGEVVWWTCTEDNCHVIDVRNKVVAWAYID